MCRDLWCVADAVCRCGLFLHSPFPSSEIFRTFPKREELLRSMLNADLIGAPGRGATFAMGIGAGMELSGLLEKSYHIRFARISSKRVSVPQPAEFDTAAGAATSCPTCWLLCGDSWNAADRTVELRSGIASHNKGANTAHPYLPAQFS